ncbi:MAG: pilin [Candidatus Daviesbacteria bacterium]|nr:pilin [Candidatus Daviesbacteria bacterium]
MTKLLAQGLTIPGLTGTPIPIPGVGGESTVRDATIGGFLTPLLDVVFLIASVLMFVWMVWGIMQYIFAGGEKEKLAKARSRITWAIVGFCIVLLSFTISQYAKEIFPPNSDPNSEQTVTTVSTP